MSECRLSLEIDDDRRRQADRGISRASDVTWRYIARWGMFGGWMLVREAFQGRTSALNIEVQACICACQGRVGVGGKVSR